MAGRNVFTVLVDTAKQHGDAVALHQPVGRKGGKSYRTFTWNQWAQTSREIALGLISLGLEKGEIVCILCETRAEFYLVDLGIMGAAGVSAALYTAYPMPDLAKNINDAAPRFLFVEDPKTLAALSQSAQELGYQMPAHVILITGEQSGTMSLAALEQRGRDLLKRDPQAFARVQDSLSPSDPAILYLTSGATGEPKMGLTSHSAILANLDHGPAVLPIGPEDSTIVFLPSAHIAQRIVLELVPMRMGTPVWFSESLSKLPAELRSIKPTLFLAPPRVWEKMYATIMNEVRKQGALSRKIFYGALGLGAEAAKYREEGRPIPLWMSRGLKIADKLVFSKVRARLGGRIRVAASGAAPLGRDLAEFFSAINLPLVEGYGLTEAGVISFNPMERPKPGSIGKLLPGVQARLTEDNELQVRTPCLFLGYYKDEAASRSVMTGDGWFSTGDIAEVDEDG
ncbi:MAG: AMP-binding protein, partial [Acidobacteriaceae bacterium]|nr:AMP-binding protein [Acidobacteriaceae bacterium]